MLRSARWILVLAAGGVGAAFAGEWPQILGPTRNGAAQDEVLPDRFAPAGPPTLWQRDVGRGYAGVAVVGPRVVLFHRVENQEVVEALDAASGKPLWKQSFAARYVSSIDPDDGPRCVPTIDQGRVYLHGADGDLSCLNLVDGRVIWRRDTKKDFAATDGYFGAGSSPIVVGDRLLVNVGGRPSAGIVAFDAATGKTLWQATDEAASYSSPVAATIEGRTLVVFTTRMHTVAVDPRDGAVKFRIPFGRRGPTVNAANPVILGNFVFLTASYGVGATLADLTKPEENLVWHKDELLASQYPTPVQVGDFLYGVDGRQDLGVANLRCIEPKTGKLQWSEEGFGMASLLVAADKLLLLTTDGQLVLARPNPEKYQELARARILDGPTRALPALAHGKLYVRDDKTLKCVELGTK